MRRGVTWIFVKHKRRKNVSMIPVIWKRTVKYKHNSFNTEHDLWMLQDSSNGQLEGVNEFYIQRMGPWAQCELHLQL